MKKNMANQQQAVIHHRGISSKVSASLTAGVVSGNMLAALISPTSCITDLKIVSRDKKMEYWKNEKKQ